MSDQYDKIEKSLQYICMSGIMSNSSPRFDYDDWITVRHILRIRFIMAEKKNIELNKHTLKLKGLFLAMYDCTPVQMMTDQNLHVW